MPDNPPLVLVVDDAEANRFVKVQVLRRAGFEVVEAGTGQAALAIMAERLADVVVLDVNLPDMSGLDVARRIKAQYREPPGIPILQVSNTAVTTTDRVKGLESGADVYLTEPVAAEVLVATVRALRRVRIAEQALAAALEREREARQIAEEASRLKDEFIATLSHELRTPLNALMGWIYQLRHSALDEGKRLRALESLERNARVQAQLINDLLDISRISKGKLHLRMQFVNLRSVVGDAVDSIGTTAAQKHLDLSVAAAESCWVIGDHARLQQIVTNLLTNATQFTPDGGRVAVEIRPVDNAAQITVTDSGMGIAPGLLPHVFDQFRQGEGGLTRKHGGLGLGLAVVRQLVELHGGSVDVASPGEGKGSTFTVLLPRETESIGLSEGEVSPLVLHGLHLLVVHRAAADVAAMLGAAGAETTVVDSAEAARTAVGQRPYDVIVGDAPADVAPSAPRVATERISNAGQLVRSVVHAARRAKNQASTR